MPNSEWPRIRTALRRHRDEVGYLTLSAYAGSGAGQQQMIGRLDLKDRMLRHWLDQVDSEDSAERLGDFLGALGRTIPSEDPDDDYTVVADEASAEAEDEDEEDESEEDDEGDDEDSDDEDDEDEATPSPAPVPTIPPLTNDEIEQGVRNWLDSTCEANTTDGSQATFRIRIYQHGGARQLWSALFRYESTAAVPIPPPPPTPALPPQPEAPSATPRSLLSRRLNMNDNGRGNGAPPYTPPSTYTPERVEKQANRVAADYAAGKGNGPAPYEVETLLHLHGLHRVFAASVLNTMSEQQKVYQKIIGELAGALSDARTHNDDLLDDVKALGLA